jgi:hypothetical protein
MIPNVLQPIWLLLRKAGVVVFQKAKPPMIKRLLCSKVLRRGLQQGLRSPFCVGKPRPFAPSIAHARPWVEKAGVRSPWIRNVVSIVMYGKPAGVWSCAI